MESNSLHLLLYCRYLFNHFLIEFGTLIWILIFTYWHSLINYALYTTNTTLDIFTTRWATIWHTIIIPSYVHMVTITRLLQYRWETNRLALISLNNMQIAIIYLFTHRRLSFTPPHLTSRPGSICFYHSVDTWLTPHSGQHYVLWSYGHRNKYKHSHQCTR